MNRKKESASEQGHKKTEQYKDTINVFHFYYIKILYQYQIG